MSLLEIFHVVVLYLLFVQASLPYIGAHFFSNSRCSSYSDDDYDDYYFLLCIYMS
jgi:hypothetical protein